MMDDNGSVEWEILNRTDNSSIVQGALTEVERWIHVIVFYIVLCGILASIGNIAMIVGIIRTRTLRSRFFVILCSLLITRASTSIQELIIGIYRMLKYLEIVPTVLPRLICHTIHFNLYYSISLEMILLLVLVMDRIIGVVAYQYYRRLTVRQAVVTCLVLHVTVMIFKLSFSYLGVALTRPVPCLNMFSPTHHLFNHFGQEFDVTVAALVLNSYIGLILYLRCYLVPKLKRESRTVAGRSALISLKRQSRLIPLLCRLVVTLCGLTLTGRLLLAAPLIWSNSQDQRIVAYGAMTVTVDIFVNVVVLLASNGELRKATFRTCCSMKKKTPPNGIVGILSHDGVTPVQSRSTAEYLPK